MYPEPSPKGAHKSKSLVKDRVHPDDDYGNEFDNFLHNTKLLLKSCYFWSQELSRFLDGSSAGYRPRAILFFAEDKRKKGAPGFPGCPPVLLIVLFGLLKGFGE